MTKKILYSKVGDDYDTKDPIKKLAQQYARQTVIKKSPTFNEYPQSRGESAYVWKIDNTLMASVVEQLGTKNLVADEMRKITGKTYYDIIGHDTVATIINDLITVGAKPLVLHALWAFQDNSWLEDNKRMMDLIRGWRDACKLSGASWGGGESPTLKGIIEPNTVSLGGSAVGKIVSEKVYIKDQKLKNGDRIVLIRSNGINANGLSLARAVSKKLPKGYATKIEGGKMYGDALLTKTNIYAKLVQDLINAKVEVHYISNITGHGLRKIMRARQSFTYTIEKLFKPQPLFPFMQNHANLTDYDMYDEFNMGQDYAIYVPPKEVKKTLAIIKKNQFVGIDAGYVSNGPRQVIIKQKSITFNAKTLNLR